MSTVHLVYPHGDSISCPDAIGRNLAARLRTRHEVILHDWDATYAIAPEPGDLLLGHCHPAPWTTFRKSMRNHGWARVVVLEPYSGALGQMAWADRPISHADLFLAICGNYWFARVQKSHFSHWRPKMIHVDLAVDRADFPPIKSCFNPPGKRRFVYIGSTRACKNTRYLAQIARRSPQTDICWIGGSRGISGLKALGFQDFKSDVAKKLVAGFDFLLTVGRADANPATILEAMAWGLIPVCTPQSGYEGFPGIVNVPLDDTAETVRILQELQGLEEAVLTDMQRLNWKALDEHFKWDRFAGQVIQALEVSEERSAIEAPVGRRLRLAAAGALSPHSALSPRQLRLAFGNRYKNAGLRQ